MNQKHLDAPDWSKIPAPIGDEDLSHLLKYKIRSVKLKSTNDHLINLSETKGLSVIYIYPMTGQPNKPLPMTGIIFLEQEDVHRSPVLLEIIFNI